MVTFGKKIKNARTAKKMTQKELALKIGAKHNSISDWENDKNKPDPDTIELLCGVLDISPNYLINSNPGESLSPAENDLVKKYRTLDTHGKKIVDLVLNEEAERIRAANLDDTELINIAKAANNQQPLLLDKDGMKEFVKKANEAPNSAHDKEMF